MMLWNRCLATSTAFQRVRRCDLRKGHGGEHLSDQGFDLFRWTECWEANDRTEDIDTDWAKQGAKGIVKLALGIMDT